MKKRIFAVFAALVLCVNMLTALPAARATGTPIFMAVNHNLLPLKDWSIPIVADGLHYIPYQVLDASSTGIDLGVYPIYNAAIRTLTIYNREKVIAFDLRLGTCSDRDGNLFSARAVMQNGQIYVPARFICQYFDLNYSYFPQTAYGPMARIYNDAEPLPDEMFLAAAQMEMAGRLNDWRKDQAAAVTPTPTPTSPQTSTRPAQTASPDPTPTTPVVDKSDVRTYLAFRSDWIDGLDSLLDRLEQYHIQAMFFFPVKGLAEYDDAVRRVLCGGHGIGLMAYGTTAEEIFDAAAEGNRILSQIACMRTYTILAPEADAVVMQEVRGGGLLLWNTDVDALPNGQNVSTRSNRVLREIESFDETVYILSDCSTSGSALMTRLLPELVEDRYDLRLAVETEI